jgi:crossover junction endodeoxyribonuclease RusA
MILSKLTLPFPPASGNNMYGKGKGGAKYVKPEVLMYYKQVYYAVHNAKTYKLSPQVQITEPCLLFVTIYPPDKRKRDIDNILKVLKDALKRSSLIQDDYLFTQIVAQIMPFSKDTKSQINTEVHTYLNKDLSSLIHSA